MTYFNFNIGQAMAQSVKRHNSKEAEAKRQAQAEKEEARIRLLFDRVAKAYPDSKKNKDHVFLTLNWNGGTLEFTLKINQWGEICLYCFGFGFTKAFASNPLKLGFQGQAMAATLDNVRVWRNGLLKDIKHLKA